MKKALIIILALMLVVFAIFMIADLRARFSAHPQIDAGAASIEVVVPAEGTVQ